MRVSRGFQVGRPEQIGSMLRGFEVGAVGLYGRLWTYFAKITGTGLSLQLQRSTQLKSIVVGWITIHGILHGVQSSPTCRGEDSCMLDNSALPTGRRVAVIVSGLAKRGLFEHTLRFLHRNVVDALGGPDRVHVFVHAEPENSYDMAEVQALISEILAVQSRKGMILTKPGARKERMREVNAWTVPQGKRAQFDRVRDAFQLVLAQEQLNQERYGWVCRTRTDTMWLEPWNSNRIALIAQNYTVAGPNFELPGHRHDEFWLASRDAAWRAFMLLPTFFYLHFDDAELWAALGCDARTEEDDWLDFRVTTWKTRGCEDCIRATPRLCPEVIVPFAFIKSGLRLADGCPITGQFVTSGFHNPVEHSCQPFRPLTRRVTHSENVPPRQSSLDKWRRRTRQPAR